MFWETAALIVNACSSPGGGVGAGGGGLVRVRTIKFVQEMNRKLKEKKERRENKCDPTLYQGAFICQTDRRKCIEVPQEATRETW